MGSAPTPWWDEVNSHKPGPARIRVTFNRDLTPAEQEHLRSVGVLVREYTGDKVRLSPDERLFVESNDSDSRDLYEAVASIVSASFVNVFPVAVRTFRERVVKPAPRRAIEQTHAVLPGTFSDHWNDQVARDLEARPEDYNLPAVPAQAFAKVKKKKGKKVHAD